MQYRTGIIGPALAVAARLSRPLENVPGKESDVDLLIGSRNVAPPFDLRPQTVGKPSGGNKVIASGAKRKARNRMARRSRRINRKRAKS